MPTFSMGGLVALELAMRHPDKLAGVVTLAAAVKFKDPLARYARQFASLRVYGKITSHLWKIN